MQLADFVSKPRDAIVSACRMVQDALYQTDRATANLFTGSGMMSSL